MAAVSRNDRAKLIEARAVEVLIEARAVEVDDH
jgi:hypothetical protein